MIHRSKHSVFIVVLIITSCSNPSKLIQGKWQLVHPFTSKRTHPWLLMFKEKTFSRSPKINAPQGAWWINQKQLNLQYSWMGGNDTLVFKILKLTSQELIIKKIAGGITQKDTLHFKR